MKNRCVPMVVALTAALAVSTVILAQSEEEKPKLGPNVRITLTIGGEGTKDTALRVYTLLARDQAPPAEMLMGWRVPIPTARQATDEETGKPVTSYVYQNVGVTSRFRASVMPDGRIRVHGEVEASGAKEGPGALQQADMPIIGTFQQSLDVVLEEGKPLRVAEVPEPEGGRMYLELTAEVLD